MISELTPEHLTSAFRRLQRDVQLHNEHPQSSLSYENELVNLLNAQNLFISKLLQSQSLLYNHLMKNGESTETGGQNNEDFQEGKIRASGQSFYNSSSSD